MDKDSVTSALKSLKENSPKRKFKQTIDLIINLKGLDLKKPEQHVELYVLLPHSKGKKSKICTFAGPELKDDSNKVCDYTVFIDDFQE